MSDSGPITREEMHELFGEYMPIEAVNLVWNSPGEMTIGELRTKLRALAPPPSRRKARAVIDRLCSDPEMWATHGMPPDHKLKRLEDEFEAAFATQPHSP